MRRTEEMFNEIKANNKKLRECKKHKFSLPLIPSTGYPLGLSCTCEKCGGILSGDKLLVYVEGYIAAGGNPEDIVPNWNG